MEWGHWKERPDPDLPPTFPTSIPALLSLGGSYKGCISLKLRRKTFPKAVAVAGFFLEGWPPPSGKEGGRDEHPYCFGVWAPRKGQPAGNQAPEFSQLPPRRTNLAVWRTPSNILRPCLKPVTDSVSLMLENKYTKVIPNLPLAAVIILEV